MQNEIILEGVYGGDHTHAQSAWTSTSRELTDKKIARMDKLIDKLMRDKHHTPFEKSTIHFVVRTDIASHIHILKHRIGVSVNGESARYKELGEKKGFGLDRFYVPDDWSEHIRMDLIQHAMSCYEKYHCTISMLIDEGFTRKRAKESARFYLPYATQIRADVMFNFRSFLHFMILRTSEDAQREIQVIANEMRRQIEKHTPSFKMTFAAFDKMVRLERTKDALFDELCKSGLVDDETSLENALSTIKTLITNARD